MLCSQQGSNSRGQRKREQKVQCSKHIEGDVCHHDMVRPKWFQGRISTWHTSIHSSLRNQMRRQMSLPFRSPDAVPAVKESVLDIHESFIGDIHHLSIFTYPRLILTYPRSIDIHKSESYPTLIHIHIFIMYAYIFKTYCHISISIDIQIW